jgi:hypothetical protein
MGPEMSDYRLPGWLVVATLLVSIALWAFMLFGTLARLSELAEGAEPFDLRPFGYGVGDARALLTLLGEEGRAYYAQVQLALDSVYPATYALSRALAVWWLTTPLRLGRWSPTQPWRIVMVCLPILAAGVDTYENARIAAMLVRGTGVDAELVASASRATQLKSITGLLSEVMVIVLGLAVFVRWRRRRG